MGYFGVEEAFGDLWRGIRKLWRDYAWVARGMGCIYITSALLYLAVYHPIGLALGIPVAILFIWLLWRNR